MIEAREVSGVIKKVAATSRGEIAVVRCSDGTYGLVWDGLLVESLDWNSDRFDECVTFVEHLAASMGETAQTAACIGA
jgi:hypothetical protein